MTKKETYGFKNRTYKTKHSNRFLTLRKQKPLKKINENGALGNIFFLYAPHINQL